jgi:hypothetical protein
MMRTAILFSRSRRIGRAPSGPALLALLAVVIAPISALATHPGVNGKIAYTDVVDDGSPVERRAVFIQKEGQFTQPVPRANQSDSDSAPAWSPDGKLLAFVRRDGTSGEYGIFVVKEDGTELRQVYDTRQLQGNGDPGLLKGERLSSLSWRHDRPSILFAAKGLAWSIGNADAGTNLPLGGGGTNVQPGDGTLEAGQHGVLAGGCFSSRRICIVDALGTVGFFDVELPDVSADRFGGTSDRSWWPEENQRKVAFVAGYTEGGLNLREAYSVAYKNPNTAALVTRYVRITPSAGVATCSNTVGGVTTTLRAPQYQYRDPVPSPDGKYVVAHRTETIPTYDEENRCSFEKETELVQFRETGGLQSTLDGTEADDVAWQPSPADLAVHVRDAQGHPLAGLKAELRGRENEDQLADGEPEENTEGTYLFEDVPAGKYRVRVTLDERTSDFSIRHDWPSDAIWVDREIVVPAEAQVEAVFTIADGSHILETNLDAAFRDRIDDLALIYYQTHRFVKWFRDSVQPDTGRTMLIHAFTTTHPYDLSLIAPDSAFYYNSFIILGTAISLYTERDGIHPDECPINCEWHEISHHFGHEFVHPTVDTDGESHGGYANPTTANSLVEGFATFLPTQVEMNPDYAGLANLEPNMKAWSFRKTGGFGFSSSLEDFAVASLLWDIVDGGAEIEYPFTLGIAWNFFHFPVVYPDNVSLSLGELWQFLMTERPANVFALHQALGRQPQFADLTLDLDNDGLMDANAVDPIFLTHGFFPIDHDQILSDQHVTYHHDIAAARREGRPANDDIGRTDHNLFFRNGVVSAAFLDRHNQPSDSNANFDVRLLDASGTPLHGGDLELTIEYPELVQTLQRKLEAGDDARIHLELPMYFDYLLPVDAPLPECDPEGETIANVTVRGSVNGYDSTDAPSFDSCTYFQAMLDTTGNSALTVTLNFPEDSTPPVTTVEARTLGSERLFGPEIGNYTVNGYWTVALPCEDPVEGEFASGCRQTEYSLDGAPFVPYEEEFDIVEPGLYTVAVRSLDAASNEESIRTVKLGVIGKATNTPPVTTLSAVASLVPGATTVSWTVTMSCLAANAGDEQGAGCRVIEYDLNATGPFVPAPYTEALVFDQPGAHTIRYRSIDVLGNREATRSTTIVVGPDTTPPRTLIQLYSVGRSVLYGDQSMGSWTVQLQSCNDNYLRPLNEVISGCARSEYSLDGGPFQPLVGEVIIDEVGQHRFEYRSIDAVGNVEVARVSTFEVVAPTDGDGDGVVDFADNCHTLANPDQRNTDGDRSGNRCDPDFNGNGTVDSNDASLLKYLLGASANTAPNQDLDGNGIVSAADMNILKSMFRTPPGPSLGYNYPDFL